MIRMCVCVAFSCCPNVFVIRPINANIPTTIYTRKHASVPDMPYGNSNVPCLFDIGLLEELMAKWKLLQQQHPH